MNANAKGKRDLGGPAQPLLTVRKLVRHFPVKGSLGRKAVVRAVDGISFTVLKGETLGVVGESGCGKSTTARLLMQLIEQDSGELIFDAVEVGSHQLPLREFRRQVQMVFQDSYSSLNPRLTIEQSVAFGPKVHGVSGKDSLARARDLLARVGLEPSRFAGRYPHELSGGQRQRVNIARALALEPRLVILDEAVSALDKSVEAQVLNLLLDLKQSLDLTYVFISHDLHVVRYLSDRILVMYLGEVVEVGPAEALFTGACHPYTRALLSSMPSMDPERRTEASPLSGDPPSPIDPPEGCRFHTRCPHAEPVCSTRKPPLQPTGEAHVAACLMVVPGGGHSCSPPAERLAKEA
ncbi:dipeptide/oligopeptide/nickel ABC transporter ATP-binding protein [Stutzerimonas nosocomialis]|uniref:Glutathione import ATP-binding protein GsiA n=1 Tax=Stutzerimonas nosocomialis TaxID=1056496 RepID=A0A5R9QFS6_9GAMM|nr:ABC transporter ATP-binding protein [Stutzerimonas nosocomialis]TLX56908.1 dipeptide/oligopeptide/nickel ABC transporter ATP-binding protein [Stutzerimonas nosocomialis]TLX58640.1 dipeptide/oligopeptide/nickel ABC transporter ATP-binding protein [Stutzerimonas nosocomialis]TLX63662.1 dipeptide/oligopeptide/nickel ABC transporter ATP-binding protein [Stutzerimonas nosocomialis]